MNTIAILDLGSSQTLDSQARSAIRGGAEWVLNSTYVDQGTWSGYANSYKNYIGTTFHDGYLSREYNEGWKRTRQQIEYTNWEHFVRV
jgi:hypothetical protein